MSAFESNYVENLMDQAPRGPRSMQDSNILYENLSAVKKGEDDDNDLGPSVVTDFVDGPSFLDRLSPSHNDTVSALDRLFGDQEGIQVDPILTNNPMQTPSGSSSPVPTKRKATSRANMLSRGGACEFCKRRKLKCTAEMPSCTACSRAGIDCVYSQKKQRSRIRVLEDRLVELEKRLEPSNGLVELQNGQGLYISPATTTGDLVPSAGTPCETSDFEKYYGITLGAGFTLSSLDDSSADNRTEPDLMTLADAAAADRRQTDIHRWPWEGMTSEAIASEIVKAVEGDKGVGEKIVGHLLQLYVGPPSIPHLHFAVPPSALLSRLSSHSTSPPHPALLLSLIPLLLPLSPSTLLSSSFRSEQIISNLSAPNLAHSHAALSSADARIIDIVAASCLSGIRSYQGARFLEGWGASTAPTAMAWAAGLGKLGGVGESFVGGGVARERKMAREKRLREIRYKGTVAEPPKNGKELGERIHLFWQVFLRDKASSIGWNYPSALADEEITTPWPRDNYDTLETLRDNRSITDFLENHAHSGNHDTPYCAQMKALCLMHRSTRLFDLPDSVATFERTSQLIRVTRSYMASLRPVSWRASGSRGAKLGPLNQAWMMLHTVMLLLHAKEEMDAPPGADDESMNNSIEAAGKVVEAIDTAYNSDDFDLEGYDLLAPLAWHVTGRTVYKYAERLVGDPRASKLRKMGADLTKACRTMGKRLTFAMVMSQLLENIAAGTEVKQGEWDRPDYVD